MFNDEAEDVSDLNGSKIGIYFKISMKKCHVWTNTRNPLLWRENDNNTILKLGLKILLGVIYFQHLYFYYVPNSVHHSLFCKQ